MVQMNLFERQDRDADREQTCEHGEDGAWGALGDWD